MSRRAPKNSLRGTSGQTRVKGQFEDLNWGTLPNPEHDIGTDLFVMARDARRFDLGALLGVQVKTGPSWFKEVEHDSEGRVEGWWFREDDSHFDSWCDHTIPHIVVLHDPDSDTSYWVHITRERVYSTGEGNKILVPKGTQINADHRDALIDVATKGVPVPNWEGSIWRQGDELPASVRLRYALVLPRIISPHPNRSLDALTAQEAIALLGELRIDDLERSDEANALMKSDAASSTATWEWRLFEAFHDWLDRRRIDGMIACIESADSVERRVAAIVCVAFARFECGDVVESVALLEAELERDEASPVDYGWLQVHLALCLLEIGELPSACASALAVQRLAAEAARDLSARALVAAASQILLSASDFGDVDVEATVQAIDTPSNWWRSQSLAAGFERHFNESFDTWAGERGKTVYMQDVAWRELRSAMVLSGTSANGPSWGYAAAMLGRRMLMNDAGDEQEATEALQLLRRSGDDQAMRRAAMKIRRDGPIDALAGVGSRVELHRLTRSSFRTSLVLIEVAADVLPVGECDRYAHWALGILSDADDGERAFTPEFVEACTIVDTLAAIAPCCSSPVRQELIKYLVALPAVEDFLMSKGLGMLVSSIPIDEWDEEGIDALGARDLGEDRIEFRRAVEEALASRRTDRRTALHGRIRSGDLDALAGYGNITELPDDVAFDAIPSLSTKVQTQTDEARRGSWQLGGADRLGALVLMNLYHPEAAQWPPVEAAFGFEKSHPSHLLGAIRTLRHSAAKVPTDVRDQLRTHLKSIAERPAVDPERRRPLRDVDIRGEAFVTLANLFPEEANDEALRRVLTSTDTTLRSAALLVLGAREDSSNLILLATLARSPDATMAATAVEVLASWVVEGVALPESEEVLRDVLKAGGTRLGFHAGRVLQLDGRAGSARLALLLEDYPSAKVRRWAERVLGRGTDEQAQ